MSSGGPITSRDNARFKALRALAANPGLDGRALLDGVHLVSTCLARGIAIVQLLASESGTRHREIAGLLDHAGGIERLVLRDSLFRELVAVTTPTGIAAVIDIPPPATGPIRGDALLLDAVQDAGNVGTILRTAAAAGVRDVLLGPGCAGAWSARVLRAGQGAHFSLAIREQADLAAYVAGSSATSIATVAGGGASVFDLDLAGPTFWLIGNEGSGLSAPLVAAAGLRATIPLAAGAESLNVAAATAICLFEARRQRAVRTGRS